MDHEQPRRAPDSKEAAPLAVQTKKTAVICESYKEKALWGFLHAASDCEDRDRAPAHDERRQQQQQQQQHPKRETTAPSRKRSNGKQPRTRLLEMSGSSASSCESIFIELCELSERLEAVEAAERRTSIATTASWRSAREAGGSASPPNVPTTTSRRPPMTPEEYWLFEANYVPASGLPTDASPVKPPPPQPEVRAPAGPRKFRRQSHPPSTPEFTMQQLVEYVMEQLPLPDVDVAELQLVPDSKPAASPNNTAADETVSPLSELKVPGDYAIEAVDRILRSGLLHCNSQPQEIVSMAKYHLVCIKEEDESFLPPAALPLEGEEQYVFWGLPRRPASVA
ncbi:hypothetical protein Emed_004795 [Eimeria media]